MSKKPVLYYIMISPPCRSVLLTAAALGIDLQLKEIDLLGLEELKAEVIRINPQHATSKQFYCYKTLHKEIRNNFLGVKPYSSKIFFWTVPFLVDNGVHIVDSYAICKYLSDKYGKDDSLYPKELVRRAFVDSRLQFDSEHLFSRLRLLYEPVFYEKSLELSQEKIECIQSQWEIMEGFLQQNLYLCGNKLAIADLCCVATVSSVNECATIDAEKYPKFTKWFKRLSQLPYYEKNCAAGSRCIQCDIRNTVYKNNYAAQSK